MDIESLQSLATIANSVTVATILLAWILAERKDKKEQVERERERGDVAWNAIQEDWQRQREREISRADMKNGGSGL